MFGQDHQVTLHEAGRQPGGLAGVPAGAGQVRMSLPVGAGSMEAGAFMDRAILRH